MHDLYAENNGVHGLYPVQSTDVLIERTEVVGANDTGIFAGQSENIVIRDNLVHGNILGIEVENIVGPEIYANYAFNNTPGIFIDLHPQLTSKVSLNTKVYNNLIEDNIHENFAVAGSTVSVVPAGSGIAILAADHVEIYDNIIRNHKTARIGIFHMSIPFNSNENNVGASPENNYIHSNAMENNGYDAQGLIANMGIPGADILWNGSGWNNRFDQPGTSSFPPVIPTSTWSDLI